MARYFPTKNDLPEGPRTELISLLNANLASGIDLQLRSKQSHWSVKGPHFFQLHELFDKVFAEATEWVDLIAERAVQLGGVAEGLLGSVSARSILPSYDMGIVDGSEHVEAIANSLAAFGRQVRNSIQASDALGDAGTADIFTEISRGVDKMLWFVEAHGQAER